MLPESIYGFLCLPGPKLCDSCWGVRVAVFGKEGWLGWGSRGDLPWAKTQGSL